MAPWVWLGIALVFTLVEMMTVTFGALFLAVGALGAALAAALGFDLLTQGVVFAVASVLGIAAVRPMIMSYRRRHMDETLVSGAGSMIGTTVFVVEASQGKGEFGHVRIHGEDWLCLNKDGSPLKVGEEVRVLEIRNTTLIVAPTQVRR